MRPLTFSRLFLVSLACGLIALPLRAEDEAGGDLQPIAPLARSLFTNQNQYQYQFRNYGINNGSTHLMSRDGKHLLTVGNNGLMVWDLSGRQQTQPHTLNVGIPNLYNAAAALSADGKTTALVPMYYGQDMAVRFFDTATGKQIREIENDEQIFGLALSPNSRLLAVSTRQRIELWNAEDGEEVRVSPTQQNAMYRLLTFSPDGKMLAAVNQQEPNTVHIWETASGKERDTVHFGGPSAFGAARAGLRKRAFIAPGMNPNNQGVLALAFSTDSRLLVASTPDSTLHLWDLQADREAMPLTGFRGQVSAMTFTPDGKELIAMDSEGTRLTWRMALIQRSNRGRLTPLSDADFAELWVDLVEPDLFRVYRARRHLVADPKRALPLLAQNLKPVPPGDTDRIKELMKDLSNANAGIRRKVMTELRSKHGEAALGALTQAFGGQAVNQGVPGGNAAVVLMQKLGVLYNTPERARDIKAVHILEEIGTPEARIVLEKLAKGAAGVGLTTEAKSALDHLTAADKERPRQLTEEQMWTDLASDDAVRAFRAMCGLSAAPRQAVDLFGKHLKPVPVVEEKEIAALLANLEADDFKTREQATQELEKIGEQALPVLKKALAAKPSLEARKRIERLVEQASAQTSGLLRGLRAIEVLEHSGTAEGRHVLVALAGGAPQARLTREAKASLQRRTR